jgi:hypothetical protein
MEEYTESFFSLREEEDIFILLHRQIHFGGKFSVMIEYYETEGVGMHPDISLKRLQELENLEQTLGQDLAELLLGEEHHDIIQDSLHVYDQLRNVYEQDSSEQEKAIADLILSENDEAEEEINQLASFGEKAVPLLIELVKNEQFRNPLYPGYGLAPLNAIRCLGRIGSEKAIYPLFEILGSLDSLDEQEVMSVLRTLGEKSFSFLLNTLQSKPFTEDNERAAFALTHFAEKPEVAAAAASLLQLPETLKHPRFAQAHVLLTENLKENDLQQNVLAIAEDPKCPKEVKEEILFIAKQW